MSMLSCEVFGNYRIQNKKKDHNWPLTSKRFIYFWKENLDNKLEGLVWYGNNMDNGKKYCNWFFSFWERQIMFPILIWKDKKIWDHIPTFIFQRVKFKTFRLDLKRSEMKEMISCLSINKLYPYNDSYYT